MPLAPTIISKWPRSSIYHLSRWIADSNLTWKSSVIIASPILFCSFLHDSRLFDSSIIVHSVGSSTPLNILVVYLSWRWSLIQYMIDTSSFFCTLVTTNISFTRFLLVYLTHAAWIPSEYSSLRFPIPLGSINMYSRMPFISPFVLRTKILSISLVVHFIGGASDASIFL